jgi:amino acid adenylation domain-containing protein
MNQIKSPANTRAASAPASAPNPSLAEMSAEEKRALLAALLKQRASSPKEYPLSYSQSRLWFFEQMTPGTSLLHVCFGLRLHGSLSTAALECALGDLQQRHAALRTAFPRNGGDPVQLVRPAGRFELPVHDVEHDPAEAERIASDVAHRPFDLVNGPLWRCALLRVGPDEHLLSIAVHHLIFDGTSAAVFLRDLSETYAARVRGESPSLPKLTLQYGDFCEWERKTQDGDAAAASLQYWRSRLAGPLPLVELPTDHARPAVQTFKGAVVTSTLPPALVARLQAAGRHQGATLFMVLLAAFNALLTRLTGETDVIVGAPVAGRTRAEIENLIGVFINTIPLRTDVSGDPTVDELIRRVRNTALEAFEHQAVPFDRMVAELHPGRALSHSPVFQILFNMQELGGTPGFDMGSVRADVEGRLDVGSKFDLTVYATNQHDGLTFTFVYNADLFSASRMTNLLDQYCAILNAVAADVLQPLSRLPLQTNADREILPDPTIELRSNTVVSLASRLRFHAAHTPHTPAVTDSKGTLTYDELNRHSDALAAELLEHGVKPGDVVTVFAHRSRSLVIALTGILKAGAAFAILDPALPSRRLIECVKRANPKCWVHLVDAPPEPSDLVEYITTHRLTTIHVNAKHDGVRTVTRDVSAFEPADRLAYVAFTSGSTGGVKAVAGSERPLRHFIDWHCRTFDVTAGDTVSMLSGLAHDPLLRDIFTPLWVGGRLAIPDPEELRDPILLARFVSREAVTLAHITPPLAALLASGASALPPLTRLRRMFFGGDRLTTQVVSAVKQVAPHVECVNYYGATETPQGIACFEVPHGDGAQHADHTNGVLPIGRGIDAVQLLVLTPGGTLASVGEPGEICVRTPYLSLGYLGDPELTRQRFVPNPFRDDPADLMYRTGDLGRYTPEGDVVFMGRTDYQVKIRGFRVELQAIETMLLQLPSVAAAVVVAAPGVDGEDELIAYWVPRSTCGADGPDLRAHLRRLLPDYMVPSWFVALVSLPQTPNGKIDRRALPPPDRNGADSSSIRTPSRTILPTTPVEDMLAAIWADVLHVKNVRRTDDFFELGGHSLLAARLIQQLNEIFSIDLPLRTLFESPTVSAMAAIILDRLAAKRLQDTRPDSAVIEINTEGTKPPFFFMHAALQGDGFYCYNLARHLGEDQPVFALGPLGLDGSPVPPTVEMMAAAHRETIRKIQPRGPYYLGGFCFSGAVAMEVARQLQAAGERVSLVAVIETRVHPPILLNRAVNGFARAVSRIRRKTIQEQLSLAARLRPAVYSLARFYYDSREESARRLRNGVRRAAGVLSRAAVRPFLRRKLSVVRPPSTPAVDHLRASVQRTNRLAIHGYIPRSYDGRLLVMWAEEEPFDARVWSLISPDVELQPVPGNHHTCITTQVDALGTLLTAALRRAQEAMPAHGVLLKHPGAQAHRFAATAGELGGTNRVAARSHKA